MFETTKEDKMYRQMLMTNVNKEALEWAQQKGIEAQYLTDREQEISYPL